MSVARWLEGWQVGAITVCIVGLVAAVVVPRSAPPDGIPLPELGQDELRQAEQRTRVQALQAASGVSDEVSLLAARVRLVGAAELGQDDAALERAARGLADAAKPALDRDAGGVVNLRSYLALRFTDAYLAYLRDGVISDELRELGGDTLGQLRLEGWLQSLEAAPSDVRTVLTAMYKRRFRKLVGSHPALAYDPVEERGLIGFFIEHPPRSALASNHTELEATQGRFLLAQLDDLVKLEPTYPVVFAKGVVLYRMGRFEESALQFDTYVQTVESGPYRLRAINHLKSAVESSEGGP